MSNKHVHGVVLVGTVDVCGYNGQQKMLFATFVEHIQASFSLISTDWLCLIVAQFPRCRDLVIFMVTKMTDQLHVLDPRTCAWGYKFSMHISYYFMKPYSFVSPQLT